MRITQEMAFKGFFKSLKNEIGNEITKQLTGHGRSGGEEGGSIVPGGGGGGAPGFNFGMVEDVLGLLSGGKNGQGGDGKGGIHKMLQMVQKYGGLLPGDANKYLTGILKIAEIFGHGLGDDTPRTERNPDGSFVDDFLKTLIGGRKIFGGGGGGRTIKDTISSGGGRRLPSVTSYDSVVQDYEALKTACLESGSLFEDELFRPEDSSVFYSNSSRRQIYWKRPHEITSDPHFFVDGASRQVPLDLFNFFCHNTIISSIFITFEDLT